MWIIYEEEMRLESRGQVGRILLDSEENNHIGDKNIDSIHFSEFDFSVVNGIENEALEEKPKLKESHGFLA